MVLAKVKTVRVNDFEDGWRETGGIKWKIARSSTNYVLQILVICPLCGRVGNLWRTNKRKGKGFLIVHDRDKHDICHVGWSLEQYDVLKEIYEFKLRHGKALVFATCK
ncbi:hypothetical protein [Archaeoglobus profundus]|uniref:Uncharacterized protein n=1 Tax=Archaeoglobus profundus (strain DSM 5631 / JCM 9629 / NBRC 100127 / Av18) TaxID=572546 RepID=D2RDM6_ARCPA|nr:hypothetical protein [Archaeoglobus profundus]ADB58220.1 hypothetical protein Arcpr_1165 [Archaeoglobus profundus DSM 5631]